MNIYYDLGGVLLNWNLDLLIQGIAKTYGIKDKKFSSFFRNMLSKHDTLELTTREFISRLGKEFNVDFDYEKVTTIWRTKLTPNPEVIKLAKECKKKGHIIGVCSNAGDNLKEVVDFKGLDFVDHWLISYELKVRKPEPEMYALFRKPAILIDDLPEMVEGAKKAGIEGILFKDVQSLRKELAKRELI